jgi:catalase
MPAPADAAVPPRDDLTSSPALSILRNGPGNFKGRKLGVLVGEGADAGVLDALRSAFEAEGATVEGVAPRIGGVEAADGHLIAAQHMIDGGPSVLFDAVVLLASAHGASVLAGNAAARDFVADAHAHCKFIGYAAAAVSLLERAGVPPDEDDEGLVPLEGGDAAAAFLDFCRKLRHWKREDRVRP